MQKESEIEHAALEEIVGHGVPAPKILPRIPIPMTYRYQQEFLDRQRTPLMQKEYTVGLFSRTCDTCPASTTRSSQNTSFGKTLV